MMMRRMLQFNKMSWQEGAMLRWLLIFLSCSFVCSRKGEDPEIHMNATQIIERWGYKPLAYDAVTEDGYILTLIRILPNANKWKPKRPVIFLQHGLESSCVDWINNLPGQSAGFYFSDAGFDVWMGNFRGNTYGRRHRTLKPENNEFWRFTWDEMAKYDLPALINKTLEISKADKLYYVGHSQGTLTAFAKFSTDQQLAEKVRAFFALAPVVTVKYIKGPSRLLAPLVKNIQKFKEFCGQGQFLPKGTVLSILVETFCPYMVARDLCSDLVFLLAGQELHQINTTRIAVYLAHHPAGTSTENVIHFGQMVLSGLCQMYDFGSEEENKKHYNGEATPPIYDISKMNVPTVLFWSANDILATPEDVERSILGHLPNIVEMHNLSDFSHLDFIWGLRAGYEIYRPVERFILKDYWTEQNQWL
ncbi:hydrolase, alpha/beta domain protein [Trichuris suis]|nr:hydrolase, alpha/beta domain protein [Trichuris suis]